MTQGPLATLQFGTRTSRANGKHGTVSMARHINKPSTICPGEDSVPSRCVDTVMDFIRPRPRGAAAQQSTSSQTARLIVPIHAGEALRLARLMIMLPLRPVSAPILTAWQKCRLEDW